MVFCRPAGERAGALLAEGVGADDAREAAPQGAREADRAAREGGGRAQARAPLRAALSN